MNKITKIQRFENCLFFVNDFISQIDEVLDAKKNENNIFRDKDEREIQFYCEQLKSALHYIENEDTDGDEFDDRYRNICAMLALWELLNGLAKALEFIYYVTGEKKFKKQELGKLKKAIKEISNSFKI